MEYGITFILCPYSWVRTVFIAKDISIIFCSSSVVNAHYFGMELLKMCAKLIFSAHGFHVQNLHPCMESFPRFWFHAWNLHPDYCFVRGIYTRIFVLCIESTPRFWFRGLNTCAAHNYCPVKDFCTWNFVCIFWCHACKSIHLQIFLLKTKFRRHLIYFVYHLPLITKLSFIG